MTKRFYKDVDIKADENGYLILLDGRVLKTPGKQLLRVPSKSRAQKVAKEWAEQGQEIDPQSMPCTRLLNVATEITPNRRDDLVAEFLSYLGTDLLCYREPVDRMLKARQDENWQDLLDWAAQKKGIALQTTTGLTALAPDSASRNAARNYARGLDDIDLTLLMHFTASFGSAILAFAVMDGHIDVRTAYGLSRLDEAYQNEKWGKDIEAEARANAIGAELGRIGALINPSLQKETS